MITFDMLSDVNKIILTTLILFSVSVVHAVKPNDAAPAFSLANSGGKERTLADYKGKVLFINFWASWCAPCQSELPQLDQLASEYEKKNFRLIAINVDKDRSHGEKALDTLRIGISNMEILWDTKSAAVSAYDLDAMPSSFIVDPNGVVRVVHMGFHPEDPKKWRNEIDSLLDSPKQ
jgi:thiol-disulfide isomerase/thioredoxin